MANLSGVKESVTLTPSSSFH